MTLRFLTAGESHGPALVGILDGMPAGVEITADDFSTLLQKRQSGYGRGERSRCSVDKAEILSGVAGGKTNGNPVSLIIRNGRFSDCSSDYDPFAPSSNLSSLTVPIPGHADFAGAMKYGTPDFRFIRERASARETAICVALSVFPRKMLKRLGISSAAFVTDIGGIKAGIDYSENPSVLAEKTAAAPEGFMTPDLAICRLWKELIDQGRAESKTLGGSGCVIFWGLPAGLGGYSQSDRRLDEAIASAVMSIPAVKSVTIGLFPDNVVSQAGASIRFDSQSGFLLSENQNGGIEGGMTNGMPVVVHFSMKPLPGGCHAGSVDLENGLAAMPAYYRSDVEAVSAAAVTVESMIAIKLASAIIGMTGGCSIDEIAGKFESFIERQKRLP